MKAKFANAMPEILDDLRKSHDRDSVNEFLELAVKSFELRKRSYNGRSSDKKDKMVIMIPGLRDNPDKGKMRDRIPINTYVYHIFTLHTSLLMISVWI